MDLTPEDQYDEATVWSDADLAKTVVNDVYSYVCDIAQEVNPDAWTDDAFFTHVYGCRDINEATVSPSNLGAYDRDDCPFKWSKQYKAVSAPPFWHTAYTGCPPAQPWATSTVPDASSGV